MRASIIVAHFGSREYTDACLFALEQHTEDYELIVVDNGTGDTFEADIVIRNHENRGFAVACNQGVAAASYDACVLLNNDTEVRAGWLDPLLKVLEEPDVGAVGAHLVYPDGTDQHGGVRLFWDRGVLTAENIKARGVRQDMEAVTGACMLVDKQKFFHVGGFDTGFWCGYEDIDLCLALRDMSFRIVYEPASVVMHHESVSGPERWSAVRENVRRLQIKWGHYEPGL
jgi:GT2 family glycosyltransferase